MGKHRSVYPPYNDALHHCMGKVDGDAAKWATLRALKQTALGTCTKPRHVKSTHRVWNRIDELRANEYGPQYRRIASYVDAAWRLASSKLRRCNVTDEKVLAVAILATADMEDRQAFPWT